MIMADILKIFLLVTGAQLVLISYWLASESLFPAFVGLARERYQTHAIRSALLGLLLGVPLAAVGFGLLQAGTGPAKATGFLILAATFCAGMLGSAGLCRQIGTGLPSPADATQPWRRVLRGAVVLVMLFLLPFLGWFAVLPLVILSGLGASLDVAWRRRRQPRAMPAPAIEAP